MKWILTVFLVLVPLGAAHGRSGSQESAPGTGATLGLARYEVEPRSATRARVKAALSLEGEGPVDLLFVWFAGQEIRDLELHDGEDPLPAVLEAGEGRVARMRLPARQTRPRALYLEYEVEVPPGWAYRYPLPVPNVPVGATGPPVVVEVLLPAGSIHADDGFPAFVRSGERGGRPLLRARSAGVPSFVHVRFGDEAPPVDAPGISPVAGGFGLSFWGFFVVAALWCLAYFAWAVRANRRDDG